MKRFIPALVLAVSATSAIAEQPAKMALDKVFLTVSAKQWVKTETPKLEVAVNATLKDSDMVKTRKQIMSQLQSIAKGDWHITQFKRSQDSSGLEKLMVRAQARINQNELNQIYQRTNSVSKPGITYRINQIDFSPSLADIEKGKMALRKKLYQQVDVEIAQLNQQFPKQHYTLNNLIFTQPGQQPMPTPQVKRRMNNTMVLSALAQAPSITVSNEITMQAGLLLASDRQYSADKNDD